MGSTVAVAVHDGHFGCERGNRAFPEVLAEVLLPVRAPAETRAMLS